MKPLIAEEVLKYMTDLLLYYLEQLADIDSNSEQQFLYGEKTAYTECLEVVQYWEKAKEYGLDFNIEKRYPL